MQAAGPNESPRGTESMKTAAFRLLSCLEELAKLGPTLNSGRPGIRPLSQELISQVKFETHDDEEM